MQLLCLSPRGRPGKRHGNIFVTASQTMRACVNALEQSNAVDWTPVLDFDDPRARTHTHTDVHGGMYFTLWQTATSGHR